MEELVTNSIVTGDINNLFDLINEASAEITVMQLELNDMNDIINSQKENFKFERWARQTSVKLYDELKY